MSSQTSKQKNSFEVRAFHFTPSEFFKDLNLTIKKSKRCFFKRLFTSAMNRTPSNAKAAQ